MAGNLNLDIDAILDKQFNTDWKGYRPSEVNQFLDLVIRDYSTFDEMINERNEKIEALQQEITVLKTRIIEMESRMEKKEVSQPDDLLATGVTQLDIIKRISRLEQAVFNKKQ